MQRGALAGTCYTDLLWNISDGRIKGKLTTDRKEHIDAQYYGEKNEMARIEAEDRNKYANKCMRKSEVCYNSRRPQE